MSFIQVNPFINNNGSSAKMLTLKYGQGMKCAQPFGKYKAVTHCELSIAGGLMTCLLTADRARGDLGFFIYFFNIQIYAYLESGGRLG